MGKHGHEERKSTKEARDAKPKAGKVKKSKLWSTLGQFSMRDDEKMRALQSFIALDLFSFESKPLDLNGDVFEPIRSCHVIEMTWRWVNTRLDEVRRNGKGEKGIWVNSGFDGKRG
ncbi:hypothetical protein Tco_0964578 [Tanacetum coccineum]